METQRQRPIQKSLLQFVKRHEALIRAMIAEMIAVLLFCIITFGFFLVEYPILANSILIGFTHAALMQATVHASGGHVNPAVTLGFCVIDWLRTSTTIMYLIAHVIGSIACIPILRLIYQEVPEVNYTSPIIDDFNNHFAVEPESTVSVNTQPDWPNPPIRFNQWATVHLKGTTTDFQGFCIEFFSGFIIMLAYCASHDPNRRAEKMLNSTVGVAAAVIGGHLIAYNFTGGGINPARILTMAYCDNAYWKYGCYFMGPITGAITGAFLYKEAVYKTEEEMQRMEPVPGQIL